MCAGRGLLLRRVCTQPRGQVGLPPLLRPDGRSLHGRHGLLCGQLRRLSRALFAV